MGQLVGRPTAISVRPEVLERLAASLEVARVPVHLDNSHGGEAFSPLKARKEVLYPRAVPSAKGSVPVLLHVYDIEIYNVDSSWITALSGVPLCHLGVEVYNIEFCFGCEGILGMWPGTYDVDRHRCVSLLGHTALNNAQVLQLLSDLKFEFPGDDYRLIGFNCQTFALELCSRLGLPRDCIPAEYLRFADGWQAPTGPAREGGYGAEWVWSPKGTRQLPLSAKGPAKIRL